MPNEEQDRNNGSGPLYQRIQSALRDRIVEGQWTVGQALPSRRLLCTEFSTTRVTLDKAIQGLVQEGILSAAAGSGTFVCVPPPPPEAPSTLRALRIGVIMERAGMGGLTEDALADNFYFGPLFQGIRDGFTGQDVDVVYAHLSTQEYQRFCHDKSLHGMVLVTPTLDALPALGQLAEAGVPYVAVGISSDAPANASLPSVDSDNRQGAADAIRHLLDLGHRRIALVNLAMSHANHHDRLEGYCRTLAAANVAVAPDDLVLLPTYARTHFEERVESWLTRAMAAKTMPTAVFACDYLMTLATLRVLRRHGLNVPGDISVVGFDDPLSAAHLTPALTTVRQPVYKLGRRAAERLLASLQLASPSQGQELFPAELIVRESTCPPRAANHRREVILS